MKDILILNQANVSSFTDTTDSVEVVVNDSSFRTNKLLFATNGFASQLTNNEAILINKSNITYSHVTFLAFFPPSPALACSQGLHHAGVRVYRYIAIKRAGPVPLGPGPQFERVESLIWFYRGQIKQIGNFLCAGL